MDLLTISFVVSPGTIYYYFINSQMPWLKGHVHCFKLHRLTRFDPDKIRVEVDRIWEFSTQIIKLQLSLPNTCNKPIRKVNKLSVTNRLCMPTVLIRSYMSVYIMGVQEVLH